MRAYGESAGELSMGGATLCLGMGARSLWDTPGRRLDQPSTDIRPVGVWGEVGGDPGPPAPVAQVGLSPVLSRGSVRSWVCRDSVVGHACSPT